MGTGTTEAQTEREVLLGRIRTWEHELDEMAAENGKVVLNAETVEDKKLVAHFENQFTIYKNSLDTIKHNVKLTGGNASTAATLDEFGQHLGKLKDAFVAFSEALL